MNGVALIAAERRRQVLEEGWSAAHDDEHRDGQLVAAAISYAGAGPAFLPMWWPWDPTWWKPSDDPVRNLVKAGALVAAEIDRLRRAAGDDPYVIPRPTPGSTPRLAELGEDGQWLVGYGHLEQRVFLSFAVTHVAGTEGIEAAGELIGLYPDIRHTWAVERRATTENIEDCPSGVCPGDEYLWWQDVDAADDGAIPITILDREG